MARDGEINHRSEWAVDAEHQLRQVCRELRARVAELEAKKGVRPAKVLAAHAEELAKVRAQHAEEVSKLREEIAELRRDHGVRPLRVVGARP